MIQCNCCRRSQQLKPFTHASPRYGELRRGSCKWLFLFQNWTGVGLAPSHPLTEGDVKKTLLHVSRPSSDSPPTTTVLQTLLRGRYLPAWKKRVTWYAQARGQFPNNPRCWSYLQAQGSTNVDMQKPDKAVKPSLSTPWGRGVYG